ncbi:MAG TPA: alpha/beta hydrolase [Tepidisphaeraceae bacterium]|nr:alpha/beta hydrolase [Tepidisphaeraceae bacterium]
MKKLNCLQLGSIFSIGVAFILLGGIALGADSAPASADNGAKAVLLEPKPIVKGAKVVTLWPAGSPELKTLKGYDQPEHAVLDKAGNIQHVDNIHNPSIELHLAPPDKANGMAIVVAAGGGNTTLWVGPEGTDIADWLNSIGISAFVERYRLQPYSSATDALADTQQSIRLIRANAKEWNIDPNRVGIMGFSAGGEQSARVALNFDAGNPDAKDPVARQSCRPDFTVLIYAGWKPGTVDLSNIPKNAPPAFCACAGVDDYFHASETIDFASAYLKAKIPVELHIYGHGGHGGGISPRKGIPFGTWPKSFEAWVTDLGMMKTGGAK